MKKYKMYRACVVIIILLYAVILFVPVHVQVSLIMYREIILLISIISFLIVFGFLFSLLNYFKQPVWKKFALISYLIGHVVAYYFYLSKHKPNLLYFLMPAFFYLPLIIAFITIRTKEIKPLAQSFAYTMFLLLIMRIGFVMARGRLNLRPYTIALNSAMLIPVIIIFLLCNKMVGISARRIIDLGNEVTQEHLLEDL